MDRLLNMKTWLPHFGTVVSKLCKCLNLRDVDAETKNAKVILGERTQRTIASGLPVKPRSWDDYAAELVAALVNSGILGLRAEDSSKLASAFQSYRASYEQLNDQLSKITTDSEVMKRSIIRLVILDLAVRHAALLVSEGVAQEKRVTEWGNSDGAMRFWRMAVSKTFRGLTLIGAGKTDTAEEGDCAKRLKMHASKFKRCLYEGDFPGLAPLRKVFSDEGSLVKALRFYGAFRLCRAVCDSFGQAELDAWLETWRCASEWFHKIWHTVVSRLEPKDRDRLLKRILIGGVGDPMVAGLISEKLVDEIPIRFKADLVAMATNEPRDSIHDYVEFCNNCGEGPTVDSFEAAFLRSREEVHAFLETGSFTDKQKPSDNLLLMRVFAHALRMKDRELEERILRVIIVEDPSDVEAMQMLGQLLDETDRTPEAWVWYERAYAVNPEFLLPLFTLAASMALDGRHKEALAVVRKIPSVGIGDGSRAHLLGTCHIRAGDFSQAASYLEESFGEGWEAGKSAALLSFCHSRLKDNCPDSVKEERR
jgi:tetratricopeptide (TPR) repeat protein